MQTIKEFAKDHNLSEEYLRQACRGYIDHNGRKTQLPPGYKSKKIGKVWMIEDIKDNICKQYLFPYDEIPFKDLHHEFIDLIIINNKNIEKPIYLLNLFDLYGPFYPGKLRGRPACLTGEYILYTIFKILQQRFAKNHKKITKIFIENIGLIAVWLFESNKVLSYNFFLHFKPCKQCLSCGRVLNVDDNNLLYFCNKQHLDDFYKRKHKILYKLISIEDLHLLYKDATMETKFSDFHNLNKKIFEVSNLIVRILLKDHQKKEPEIVSIQPVQKIFYDLVQSKQELVFKELESLIKHERSNKNKITRNEIGKIVEENINDSLFRGKGLKETYKSALKLNPLYQDFCRLMINRLDSKFN